jgi:cytochrome d ubiquinol oxidase subunit I
MLFGWKRVPPWLHMLATTMVWFGATLSAFWILVANSWMHTPQGVQFIDGRFVVQDWLAAVFTPSLWTRFPHMYLAAIESTLVVLGGVSAWFLLKGRHTDFYRRSFRFALIGLLITAPVQVLVGDASGLVVAEHQPAKLAAIEAHWKTNPEGEGAAWVMLAAPDQAAQKNDWEILVPNLLSLIVTHSPDGQVKGLSEFPRADQPNVPVIFWSFRVMFAIGFALALLAVATAWMAWRRRLWDSPWLLRAWVVATPLGFIATEAGWVTAEVGRQPWVVYGMMRTRDALSTLPDSVLHTSLALYAVIYVLLLGVFLLFSGRVLRTVPDEAEPPVYVKPGHLEISHA